MEKSIALVIRNTDWSETSRISTLWTRELGKVRCLAKGGRRLRSNFESALDLLTVCSIVLLRKSSGSLDLLTEAQVAERFPQLRHDLSALYGAYYVAELLGDWSEDYDPHPALFDEAISTLRTLGQPQVACGPRLARFELVLLRELGYGPALAHCASCEKPISGQAVAFSAAGGGTVCGSCQGKLGDRRLLTLETWQALQTLSDSGDGWKQVQDPATRAAIRQVLNDYVTYSMGRRPRLLPYLGS